MSLNPLLDPEGFRQHLPGEWVSREVSASGIPGGRGDPCQDLIHRSHQGSGVSVGEKHPPCETDKERVEADDYAVPETREDTLELSWQRN